MWPAGVSRLLCEGVLRFRAPKPRAFPRSSSPATRNGFCGSWGSRRFLPPLFPTCLGQASWTRPAFASFWENTTAPSCSIPAKKLCLRVSRRGSPKSQNGALPRMRELDHRRNDLSGYRLARLHGLQLNREILDTLLQVLGRSCQQWESSKMHGNHHPWLQQPTSIRGFARPHGKHVSDWEHGHVRAIELVDDLHVAENVRVSGMIDLDSVLELNHIPAWLAAVNDLAVVFDAAGVVGMDHRHGDVAYLLRAPFVHGHDLLRAFPGHPEAELVHANYLGVMFLRQLYGIADMVAVTVSAEHYINRVKLFLVRGRCWIAHDPGVDDDFLAARRFDQKRRVPEPGEFDSVQFHARSSQRTKGSSPAATTRHSKTRAS